MVTSNNDELDYKEMELVGAGIFIFKFTGRNMKEIKILLVIDNVGGHGTKDTIETYCEFLKEHYNIVLQHQTPRSPGHNKLDLGIWCSI